MFRKRPSSTVVSSSANKKASVPEAYPTDLYSGNWDTLELIWPLEDRPEGHLREKQWINAQPLDTLLKFMDSYQKVQKELSSSESVKIDKKPKKIMYEASEDDFFETLHPARFLRFPLCDRDKYWSQVPIEIKDKYRNIDLKSLGAECEVSEKTILKTHNRREILNLKFFSPSNSGVSRGPLVEAKVKDGNKLATYQDYNWVNVTTLKGIKDAIINYGLTKQTLFPYDTSGYCLLKLYNNYHWFPNVGSDYKRSQFVQEHFNQVMESNASLACYGKAPNDYNDMENSLKRLLEQKGFPNNPTSLLEQTQPNSSNSQTARKSVNSFNSAPRSSFSTAPGNSYNSAPGPSGQNFKKNVPPIGPGGRYPCYDFNNVGKRCNKFKTNFGCRDQMGKEYAHCCLHFDKLKNSYCFGDHSKQQHK